MNSGELRAIDEDDRLLDALGAGLGTGDDDPVTAALADWRTELVAAAAAAADTGIAGTSPRPAARQGRRVRRGRGVRRGLAAAAATAAALTGGSVAAAAAGGAHGPLGGLHQLIFGTADRPPVHTEHIDATAHRATLLLAHASRLLHAAPSPIPAARHDLIAGVLDRAGRLITSETHLDATRAGRLGARLHRLRSLLATLSASPPGAASSPSAAPGPGADAAPTGQASGADRSDGPSAGPSGRARGAGSPSLPGRGRSIAPQHGVPTPSARRGPPGGVHAGHGPGAAPSAVPGKGVGHGSGHDIGHVVVPGPGRGLVTRPGHQHGHAPDHRPAHRPGGAHADGLPGKKLRRQ